MNKAQYLLKRLNIIEERFRVAEQDEKESSDMEQPAEDKESGNTEVVPMSRKDYNPDGSLKSSGQRINDKNKKK
jgi:hypothetical protein